LTTEEATNLISFYVLARTLEKNVASDYDPLFEFARLYGDVVLKEKEKIPSPPKEQIPAGGVQQSQKKEEA
jgi:hypothetical protein